MTRKNNLTYLLFAGTMLTLSNTLAMDNTPLTLQQYQQCQARSEQSNQHAQQLLEQKAELEQIRIQITQLTEQRDNLGQALDLHNMQSVDQYNSINQKLNNLVTVFETEAEVYNQSIKAYKKEVAILKQQCDGRPYIEK